MTENRAGLRLVAPTEFIPPIIEEPIPERLPEVVAPRSSTRRYLIVFAIIAVWCSLLALAAYSPAK